MTLKSPDETFVHTASDLFELWADLMGSGSFAQRSLWLIFVEHDGRLSPVVVPIDDLPAEPDELFVRNIGSILEDVIQPPVRSVALLLSRPGPGHILAADRLWVRALRAAVNPLSMPWPVHLATIDGIRVFAPDDLVLA